MKLYALYAFLISFAHAEELCKGPSNLKDLQNIVKAQAAQQWTTCDYNGKIVSCKEWHKLVNKKQDKSVDPNLSLP